MSFDPVAFFIERWRFTIVLIAMAGLLGVNALLSTPRSEDPHFPIPSMTVRAVLPGATPAEIEQLLAKPIEEALYALDDVREVGSTSADGVATVSVDFAWSTDPNRKYDEVVREVNALRGDHLPSAITQLEVLRARTSETAIFQAALVSEGLPMRQLEKTADRLRESIGRIGGIREAEYWGAPGSEVRVALDLARLAQLRLPASTVTDALARAGVETPIGTVHAGERRFSLRQGGAFNSLGAVRATPVVGRDGAVLTVGDLAQVDWATEEAAHLTRFQGRRALLISATQKEGFDLGQVTADVRAELDRFERTLPAGVKLERAFFQADNVDHRLAGLTRDFLIALVIVSITLLPLGLRAAGVVMIAIPLSLLVGLAVVQALGFGLNQLTIAGFVLSLGLLVDDSIVVIENIARRMRGGEDRRTAAIQGTRQIFLAVAGCTACLMLAFLPLLALPGGAGAFMRSLPVTVLSTIGASFVVAVTVIPFVATRLLSPSHDPHGNRLLRAVDRGIQTLYRPVLHRALRRPGLVLAGVMGLCLLSWPMLGVIGTSLFPPAGTPQFLVRIETPQGASLKTTDRALAHVEQRLAQEAGVAWYAANLGRGNPRIYYNMPQREPAANFAEVAVGLDAWRPGRSEQVLERLRRAFLSYPGARITVVNFVQGPALEAPIELRLAGADLDTLQRLSRQAETVLAATPGVRDARNPLSLDRTDLALNIDDARASALGVAVGAAREAVQIAVTGREVARFRDADGDDYGVRVRLPMASRNDVAVLDDVYAPSTNGAAVPLSAIAAPRPDPGLARIDRFNRERTVTLTAYVVEGALTSEVTERAQARVLDAVKLPPGYTLQLGGEAGDQATNMAGWGAALVIAIVGILAVLVLEFGRFRLVLVVIGIVPLGLLGAVTALMLTGNSLSFTAMIGVVALIGIEVKNSILLVDFTEQLRAQGVPIDEAVEQAGEIRFLPVLLTSVTAIGGLLPLALEGGGLYAPMAVAIIGGLVSSTLLSRIATPVMYLLLARRPKEALA